MLLWALILLFIKDLIIWSRQRKSVLFHSCTLNMAVFHSGLRQGRLILGFLMFRQLQLPVPHPSKCSCCVVCQCALVRPDTLRTPWSSRPDTVFLLAPWGLLNDLPRSTLHTEPGCPVVDFHRCCVQRIRCYEDELVQSYTVHTLCHIRFQCVDVRWCKISTVALHADTGSCCRCHRRCEVALLRILQQ